MSNKIHWPAYFMKTGYESSACISKRYGSSDEQDIHFNQLYAACGSRIKQERVCPVRKCEISYDELFVVLEDQGRDTAAISAYQQALQRDPNFRAAHCSLAKLYERLGRAKDTLRHYAAAKRCRPETQLE